LTGTVGARFRRLFLLISELTRSSSSLKYKTYHFEDTTPDVKKSRPMIKIKYLTKTLKQKLHWLLVFKEFEAELVEI